MHETKALKLTASSPLTLSKLGSPDSEFVSTTDIAFDPLASSASSSLFSSSSLSVSRSSSRTMISCDFSHTLIVPSLLLVETVTPSGLVASAQISAR